MLIVVVQDISDQTRTFMNAPAALRIPALVRLHGQSLIQFWFFVYHVRARFVPLSRRYMYYV